MATHLEAARDYALTQADVRITAASMFVGVPRKREINLGEDEADELKSYLRRSGIRVIAHNIYTAAPWRGDPDAARFIREQLRACQRAEIEGLVVHLPKQPVEDVVKYLDRLVEPKAPDVTVYFETPAVRPGESYYETPEKLRALYDSVGPKFGVCVDTAHLWTCGIDLSSRESAEQWVGEFERLGIFPHTAFHLNDSDNARGRGPDVHAALGKGKIWEAYRDRMFASGLAAFTDFARRYDCVMILERKPPEALINDYAVLRDLLPL